MKILLVGEYFSTNLGDPLLCRVVENVIKSEYPHAEIIPMDISGKCDYDSLYTPHRYSALQRMYFRLSYRLPGICARFPLFRIYATDVGRHMRVISMLDELLSIHKFDLAVFAGGAMFMDYFAGVIYQTVFALSKKNIPVIFHACGMGNLTPDAHKILRRAIHFPNVKWISLRDSYALFMEQFSPRCPVRETYDTALLCSLYFPQTKKIEFDYGIGLMAIDEYKVFQKELINWVNRSGKTWCVFTNGTNTDYLFAQDILSELNISHDYLVYRPKSPQELMQIISCCKQIFSFRMHSQIIASSLGIPSFGFTWDSKIVQFHNKLGFPDNCCTPSSTISFERIFEPKNAKTDDLYSISINQGELSKDCLLEGITYALNCRRVNK